MKKLFKLLILNLFSTFLILSCSKDEVASVGSSSRDVKYEITGNYSGKFLIVATTNNDMAEVIEVSKLPWQLEFKAKASITSLTALARGENGKKGETASLKTYVGGNEVMSGTGTALDLGIISMNNALYILK